MVNATTGVKLSKSGISDDGLSRLSKLALFRRFRRVVPPLVAAVGGSATVAAALQPTATYAEAKVCGRGGGVERRGRSSSLPFCSAFL